MNGSRPSGSVDWGRRSLDASSVQSGIRPPSTLNDWPVMLRAPGEPGTTMAAMSSGSFARFNGITLRSATFHFLEADAPRCARTSRLASDKAVRVTPGQTALTLMLVPGQLLRRGLGQADHGTLACGVGRVGRALIAFAGDRGDVDDASAAPWNRLLRHALQAEEHALRIDAVDTVPVGLVMSMMSARYHAALFSRMSICRTVAAPRAPCGRCLAARRRPPARQATGAAAT